MKKLEDARAIVDRLQVYKTEKTNLSDEPAAADFRARGADAILGQRPLDLARGHGLALMLDPDAEAHGLAAGVNGRGPVSRGTDHIGWCGLGSFRLGGDGLGSEGRERREENNSGNKQG